MQIFGEIPFIKPQNDTYTTVQWLKTMKNEKETYVDMPAQCTAQVYSVHACTHAMSYHLKIANQ